MHIVLYPPSPGLTSLPYNEVGRMALIEGAGPIVKLRIP